MSARVGLLGGTFDPPHLGHLVVAEVARVALRLDEVRLVVAGDPWMKETTSPADVRVELVRAAVAGNPHLHVDDREVRREGPTFTADTLEQLTVEEPGTRWWFILGMDAANALPRWDRVADALDLATFVAVSRPGHDPALDGKFGERIERLEVPLIDVASSQLRDRVRRAEAVRYLIPDGVLALIDEYGLYADPHD
jgi:nicotinate-nucleotide adenylyltransferase